MVFSFLRRKTKSRQTLNHFCPFGGVEFRDILLESKCLFQKRFRLGGAASFYQIASSFVEQLHRFREEGIYLRYQSPASLNLREIELIPWPAAVFGKHRIQGSDGELFPLRKVFRLDRIFQNSVDQGGTGEPGPNDQHPLFAEALKTVRC